MSGDRCLFCDIGDGAAESAMVFQDESTLAFLDIRPLFLGHVLVVPRGHHKTLMDLPLEELAPLMLLVQRLSIAVKEATESDGIFVASNNGVSQSVDHLHVHVVPRRKKDGLRGFMWPRQQYQNDSEMRSVAKRIAEALEGV